jgi:GxxExxY protein
MPILAKAPYAEVTYEIIGAALTVFRKIGPGHKEAVYQAMLTDEMVARGLTVEPERKTSQVLETCEV